MLNPAAVRGRNEDLDDLEEKGLLIGGTNGTNGDATALELDTGGTTPRRRAKGETEHFEKLDLGVREEAGLKSKRDQQAFALLIVLCEWIAPPGARRPGPLSLSAAVPSHRSSEQWDLGPACGVWDWAGTVTRQASMR